jgi:arylsulfatase A-like enzyme
MIARAVNANSIRDILVSLDMSNGQPGFASCIGAAGAGGVLAGAIIGAVESVWLVCRSASAAEPAVVAFGLVLYSSAGLVFGLAVGIAIAVLRKFLRRGGGTRGGVYTVAAGLVLALMGYPVAKFVVGRDLFMERLVWSSMKGLAIQACILAVITALFFALATGLRRVLDRLPDPFTGPLPTPAAVAVLALALHLLPARGTEGPVAGRCQARARGPDIVVVMVDTLRHDVTDPMQGGLTPNLAALARRGVTFENAHAHSSWTRPSVATVLSGRYPSSHGAMFKTEGLSDDVDTIAERLSAAGYATKGIVSNYVTAPYFGFGQGFDSYTYLEPVGLLGAGEVASRLGLIDLVQGLHARFAPRAARPGARYRDGSHVTAEALRWVEGWTRSAGPDDRFFLFVQYMDPHDPYFSHPDDGNAPSRQATPHPAASMRDRLRALYEGEVRYWDAQFGLLVEGLEKTDRWHDTLILVFSDHGEEFFEHGGWWHGDTLYEEVIHVPLVVRLPRDEAAGEKVPGLVGLVDVAPTLVRLGGGKVPASFQGADLFEARDGPIFAEQQHVGNDLQALVYKNGAGQTWKVIACDEDNPRGLSARSLFNLSDDPAETDDLAAEQGAALEPALIALGEALARAAGGAVKKRSVEIDEAVRERLEELGYVR